MLLRVSIDSIAFINRCLVKNGEKRSNKIDGELIQPFLVDLCEVLGRIILPNTGHSSTTTTTATTTTATTTTTKERKKKKEKEKKGKWISSLSFFIVFHHLTVV